ncbi:MAG: aldo/keto reductase [Verrucomicrobiales bacterium]|nr:aldo/keto reductase [Verrucomicrobiales bacterium]
MANHPMVRREFLKQGTLSLAVLAGGSPFPSAVGRRLRADDVVTLGRSKLLASRQGLGLGDGKGESVQKIGQTGFTKRVRHALDQGIRYFDLLPGPAHEMLAAALKGVPRESYTLVTNFRHPVETNPAKMIECYLKELKTDYLDGVLVGAILTKDWATEDRWAERRDLLSAAKQCGRVRAHGVSVHSWEALNSLATDPWVELALVSCNHRGTWMDAPAGSQVTDLERRDQSVPVIARIHAAGIGVAGMKVFSHSGYRDTEKPAEERRKAIRFVLGLGTVDTLPILCESIEEFDEVTAMINEVGSDRNSA